MATPNKLKEAFDHDPNLKNTYRNKFDDPEGEIILMDLDRQARRVVVDASNINRDNAVYRVAQEDLIQYIKNKLEN